MFTVFPIVESTNLHNSLRVENENHMLCLLLSHKVNLFPLWMGRFSIETVELQSLNVSTVISLYFGIKFFALNR